MQIFDGNVYEDCENITHVHASQEQPITLDRLNISESYNIIDVETDFSEASVQTTNMSADNRITSSIVSIT